MTARLTSAMQVSAMLRRVTAAGGNAVIVSKGDPTGGSILLQCLEKGRLTAFRERILRADGDYAWMEVGPTPGTGATESHDWLERRRRRDTDLWIVELDIANAERFAAETTGDD